MRIEEQIAQCHTLVPRNVEIDEGAHGDNHGEGVAKGVRSRRWCARDDVVVEPDVLALEVVVRCDLPRPIVDDDSFDLEGADHGYRKDGFEAERGQSHVAIVAGGVNNRFCDRLIITWHPTQEPNIS